MPRPDHPLSLADIRQRMYRYCAYQERSPADVRRKLAELGCPPADAGPLQAELAEQGFFDAERYARAFVRGKAAGRGWGRVKLRHRLAADGITDAVVERVLTEELADDAYTRTLHKLARRKAADLAGDPPGPARTAKLVRYLQAKGYEWDAIRTVLHNGWLADE